MTTTTTEYTLRYTQHLLSPLSLDFIISSFMIWLILIGLVYLFPLFIQKYFTGIMKYPLIQDLIFLSLYSLIYIYWLSDRWDGLNQNTYELFYWYTIILYLALIVSVFIRRKYFIFNYKWILLSYWIGFCLLFVWNAIFELIEALS